MKLKAADMEERDANSPEIKDYNKTPTRAADTSNNRDIITPTRSVASNYARPTFSSQNKNRSFIPVEIADTEDDRTVEPSFSHSVLGRSVSTINF